MLKKTISIIICMAMLTGCLSGLIFTAGAATAFNVNTLIECEAGKLNKDSVSTQKDKTASGSKYIIAEGAERIDEPNMKKPDASWNIKIPAEGSYTVYLKAYIPSGSNDSLHFWWDNGAAYTTVHPGENTDWKWIELGETQLKAGDMTFAITHREPGAYWDAIFVSDGSAQPPAITTSIGGGSSAAATATASGTGKLNPVKTIETKDGSVMFEAEDIVVDTGDVTIEKESGASGKSTVVLSLDDRNAPAATTPGGLEANIKADIKGTYNIWIKYVSTDGGTDSSWGSVGGASYKDTPLPPESSDAKDYHWLKYGTVTGIAEGAAFNFKIRARETGAKIDKFIITNNTSFTPDGEGRLPQPGEVIIAKLDETRYPAPTVTPPPEHPRVLFRAKDIPAIIANIDAEQNQGAKKNWEAAKVRDINEGVLGENTGSGNYSTAYLETIEALAFDYALFGTKQSADKAVLYMDNLLKTCDYTGNFFDTRYYGHTIFVASEVYDWCHDVMNDEMRKIWVSECENMASLMEIGWPPIRQGAICGHGGEAQLLRDFLGFGIATYDEYPDIYNFCAGRILSEYLEPTEHYYASHSHHQGSAYGAYRWGWVMWSHLLFRQMSGVDVFTSEIPNVGYYYLYLRRPDGQMFRQGDEYNEVATPGQYWNTDGSVLFYAANMFGDPYLKREYQIQVKNSMPSSGGSDFYTCVDHLIVNDPTLEGKSRRELPLTKYFGSPNGTMIARTSWDMGMNAPTAAAFMKIGEHWGSNHDHLDAGTFQLYYKGALASESGYYESYGTLHDGGYNKKTIAHNALLIYDPDEKMTGYQGNNDGGQFFPANAAEPATMEAWNQDEFYRAKVIGHEFGPDTRVPEYNYLAGDITNAYRDTKADEVLRSMLFINTNDTDHPGVMVVMDKVVSTDKSFKKTWLLHMQEEPQVNGNKTIVTRTDYNNNGRMVVETLLPKNASITKIGGEGKEYFMNDMNYSLQAAKRPDTTLESGWGRVEVSPKEASKEDYFLNVLTVSDADTQALDIESKLIEGDNYAGAVFGNYAAVFAKDSKDKISDSLSFNLSGNGDIKVFVAGLSAGTWSINGLETQIATEEGGCIYFTVPAGRVELKRTGSAANKEFSSSPAPYTDGVTVQVSNGFIYSDVEPTIINDRTLVPMRAIFEALGADVSYDGQTSTATATLSHGDDIDPTVLKITEDSTTAYLNGDAMELDVPAMVLSDRFVVPVRFVSETMGAKVDWDEFSKVVRVTPGAAPIKITKQEGYAMIVSSSASEVSAEFFDTNSWDGDPTTLWSAQGEHYVDYVFDKEYTIEAVEIMLNQNSGRDAKFEVLYSTDGENYISLYDGHADGKVGYYKWEKFSFEPVTAKYFRYYAKGSNISMWNGLQEIRFKEKQ